MGAELVQRKGMPAVASLAGEACLDWQRTRIDVPSDQCLEYALERYQRHVERTNPTILDHKPGGCPRLAGEARHPYFPPCKLCGLRDLFPAHDPGIEELCPERGQDDDVAAFENLFSDSKRA